MKCVARTFTSDNFEQNFFIVELILNDYPFNVLGAIKIRENGTVYLSLSLSFNLTQFLSSPSQPEFCVVSTV